jgi:hypothetical protein
MLIISVVVVVDYDDDDDDDDDIDELQFYRMRIVGRPSLCTSNQVCFKLMKTVDSVTVI